MVIFVTLHTVLRNQFPDQVFPMEVSLPEGSTLQSLAQTLGITDIDSLFFVVNGLNVWVDQRLSANDKVDLVPAISGGAK